MEDVMLTDFKTLSPADTLEDALHKAVHSLQDDFPVVRGSDMVGVISRQQILDALRNDGNGYVQSAMNKVFQVRSAAKHWRPSSAKLGQKGLSVVPVVEGEHLVGIVTLQNLMHSMAVLAESREITAGITVTLQFNPAENGPGLLRREYFSRELVERWLLHREPHSESCARLRMISPGHDLEMQLGSAYSRLYTEGGIVGPKELFENRMLRIGRPGRQPRFCRAIFGDSR